MLVGAGGMLGRRRDPLEKDERLVSRDFRLQFFCIHICIGDFWWFLFIYFFYFQPENWGFMIQF